MGESGLVRRILRGGFRPQKTRLQIDWMTHTDEEILRHLEGGKTDDPDSIAAAVERSEEYVADRCRQLEARDLLIVDDGNRYGLADRGERYLSGDIDVDELKDDTDK